MILDYLLQIIKIHIKFEMSAVLTNFDKWTFETKTIFHGRKQTPFLTW